MKKLRKYLLVSAIGLILLAENSCAPRATKQFEKLTAARLAQQKKDLAEITAVSYRYLATQLQDQAMLERIVLDTVYADVVSTVVYHVKHQQQLHQYNMLLVFVNNAKQIDTTYIRLNPSLIRQHMEDPATYRLLPNRDAALEMARREQLEPGIKPWEIRLMALGETKRAVFWMVKNTLQESNQGSYHARGRYMNFHLERSTIEFFHWQAVS